MIFEPFPEAGYLDQFAHALVGAMLTTLWMDIGFVWYGALILTMWIAFVREMIQHPFKVGPGSRTDLLFWLIGCVLAVLII